MKFARLHLGMLVLGLTVQTVMTSSCHYDEEICETPVSRQCAPKILIKKGWLDLNIEEGVHVFMRPRIVNAGDILTDSIEHYRFLPVVVSERSWIFLGDWEPGANWGHPADWILIGIDTGSYQVISRNSYPLLNGVAIFSTDNEREHESYRLSGFSYEPTRWGLLPNSTTSNKAKVEKQFYSYLMNNEDVPFPVELPDPAPVNNHYPSDEDIDFSQYRKREGEFEFEFRRRVRGFLEELQTDAEVNAAFNNCGCNDADTEQKLALVINGGRMREGATQSAAAYYADQGYETQYLSPSGIGENRTTLPNIEEAFRALSAKITSCCDRVMVIVNAHGSPNGSIEMNPKQTRERHDGTTYEIGHPEGGTLWAPRFKDMLNTLRSCDVTVWIDSCFSGSHLERSLNQLTPEIASHGCMCRLVVVSSSARQISGQGALLGMIEDLGTMNFKEAFLEARHGMSGPSVPFDRTKRKYLQTMQVQSTPPVLCLDPDGDGVYTGTEIFDGTDINDPDSDDDGLNDGVEKGLGTDPLDKDTDNDGLDDGVEIWIGTDPNDSDTDGDGLNDQYEIFAGTDPHDTDTDDDGLIDGDEVYIYHTNPADADSDDDEFNDGTEIENGTDPNDPESY